MAFQERGRWRVHIWSKGRRLSKSFPNGTPKKVVDDYERKVKLGQIDPSLCARSVPTFKEFSEWWLADVCKVEHSFSYHKKSVQVCESHLWPVFGKLKIDRVTSQDIVDLQRKLRSKTYAVQTISNILATASSIFREAVMEKVVQGNPVAGIKRLKKEQKEIKIWSFEETDRFLEHIQRVNFPVFQACAFALHTGLRPMELRGLLRDSVDFDFKHVRVRRQWCTKQNKLVEYTKTRIARTVPVSPEILRFLADKRGLRMDEQLFPKVDNSFGHRVLKPLMRAAGVREIRLHDFRHTFASHMLMNGAHIMQVKELLGHRKLESTMIYLHFIGDRNGGSTDILTRPNASWLNPVVQGVARIGLSS